MAYHCTPSTPQFEVTGYIGILLDCHFKITIDPHVRTATKSASDYFMNYRSEIDGLRAAAVIPVVFFHAGFKYFEGGFIGVDVFYVISGYLITSLILNGRKEGTFSILKFYERRIRRILPALFVVLGFSIISACLILLPGALKEFSDSLIAASLFVSNFLFWQESGYFATANELKPLIHTWSLSVEEQYYILFPFFLMVVYKYCRKFIIPILVGIFVTSIVIADIESRTGSAGAFYLLPTRAWEIIIGVLCAYYHFSYRYCNGWYLNNIASMTGAGLLVYSIFTFDASTPVPGYLSLYPTTGTALIILFAIPGTFVNGLLSKKPIVFIGLISYSLYLWHQPLFAFTRYYLQGEPSLELYFALMSASLLMSTLSWKYVERPFRNQKIVNTKVLLTTCGLLMLMFISIGLFGHVSNGLISRYPASDHYLLKTNEEFGNYVWQQAARLDRKSFRPEAEDKILIIGDSYSQDLINAVFESSLHTDMDTSSIPINSNCDRTQRNIKCLEKNITDSVRIKNLLSDADSIWITLDWSRQDIADLKELLSHADADFKNKLLVFGSKAFGTINKRSLLLTPLSERLQIKHTLTTATLQINELLRASLPSGSFVDVLGLFCDASDQCPLFSPDNNLISYDGRHLTQFGAKFYGRQLTRILHQPDSRPALSD